MLELSGSRFEASSVLSLLDIPPVKKKFNLSEDDMERIRHWIMDTRIKWGMDEENRRQAGLPAFAENTWKLAWKGFCWVMHCLEIRSAYSTAFCPMTPLKAMIPRRLAVFQNIWTSSLLRLRLSVNPRNSMNGFPC